MNVDMQSFFGRHRRPLPNVDQEEFNVYDVERALAHYHLDYGGVPQEMLTTEVRRDSRMSSTQQELYADLLEAKAEGRLAQVLDNFREFIEDGE